MHEVCDFKDLLSKICTCSYCIFERTKINLILKFVARRLFFNGFGTLYNVSAFLSVKVGIDILTSSHIRLKSDSAIIKQWLYTCSYVLTCSLASSIDQELIIV